MSSKRYTQAPTGDAYTDAVLQISFNSLHVLEGKRAFDNYVHFFRYFCWALNYLRYDTRFDTKGNRVSKERPYTRVETLRWGQRLTALNWLQGTDTHQVSGKAKDEQLARMLYTRYVKASPCGNEFYVLMREFTPPNPKLRPFCRANAKDYGRNCFNINSWTPVAVDRGGGDGGGGLGRADDAKWEEQLATLNAYSDMIAGVELQTLFDSISTTPTVTAGTTTDTRVAVAMPRGGRRARRPLLAKPTSNASKKKEK